MASFLRWVVIALAVVGQLILSYIVIMVVLDAVFGLTDEPQPLTCAWSAEGGAVRSLDILDEGVLLAIYGRKGERGQVSAQELALAMARGECLEAGATLRPVIDLQYVAAPGAGGRLGPLERDQCVYDVASSRELQRVRSLNLLARELPGTWLLAFGVRPQDLPGVDDDEVLVAIIGERCQRLDGLFFPEP